ncbi:MAG: M24 family metallopeptidase [Rhabdochlamydiaceae bacterium]|nr:M24 family metallopeptidase [Candidatus Amphrikana amoebophyrae]
MISEKQLHQVKEFLKEQDFDGWLIYDFKRSNDIAHSALKIPLTEHITRPFYYWIPKQGDPKLLLNTIEKAVLSDLPGERILYMSYEQRLQKVKNMLSGSKRILMEISENNRIPYLSKVCFGVVDQIRSYNIEVASSGNMLQLLLNRWDEVDYASHTRAAEILKFTYEDAFDLIRKKLDKNESVYEGDVQKFIAGQLTKHGLVYDGLPSVAVNANAANPHYHIGTKGEKITCDQLVLIDLWGRENKERGKYADITVMAFTGDKAPEKMVQVLQIVRAAQKKGFELIEQRYAKKEGVTGAEVDHICRREITDHGFGDFFIHRTGHNIDVELHGAGAHLDSLETIDDRLLVPSTCFSIEPGIYLPGEFGVRLESDVFIHENGKVEMTTDTQEDFYYI